MLAGEETLEFPSIKNRPLNLNFGEIDRALAYKADSKDTQGPNGKELAVRMRDGGMMSVPSAWVGSDRTRADGPARRTGWKEMGSRCGEVGPVKEEERFMDDG